MSTQDREEEIVGEVVGYARRALDEALDLCESPIERLMVAALLRQFGSWPDFGRVVQPSTWLPAEVGKGEFRALRYTRAADGADVTIVPQLPVTAKESSYRLDIAVFVTLEGKLLQKIVVECDGHDFHERTKDQARRDRSRDRDLQAEGWRVLRFTGSEIVSNPELRAAEVVAFVAPGGSAPEAPVRRATPSRPTSSMRIELPGPAADALGLLIAFPQLGPIAEEENLPSLLPAGPLADLARDIIRGPVPPEAVTKQLVAGFLPFGRGAGARELRRIDAVADAAAKLEPVDAARELRKAAVKATLEAVRAEHDRILATVAKSGPSEGLSVAAQVASMRRRDLEKRLKSLEKENDE